MNLNTKEKGEGNDLWANIILFETIETKKQQSEKKYFTEKTLQTFSGRDLTFLLSNEKFLTKSLKMSVPNRNIFLTEADIFRHFCQKCVFAQQNFLCWIAQNVCSVFEDFCHLACFAWCFYLEKKF